MAKLIQCVTCGKDVSTNAEACPHCGETNFEEGEQERVDTEEKIKDWVKFVILASCLLAIPLYFFFGG